MKKLIATTIHCFLMLFVIPVSYMQAQTNNQKQQVKKENFKKGRVFLSLNPGGEGESDAVTKRNFSYVRLTIESGIWVSENFLAGISINTARLFDNYGLKDNYVPFGANVFAKYYPFKRRGWRWLGIQAQGGFANSSMDVFSPKKKIFSTFGIGPCVNLAFGRSGFGFNASALVCQYFYPNAQPNFIILHNWINFRPYMGISYTFKKIKPSSIQKK